MNSNMRITHTGEVNISREVTGVEKSLIQKIVSTVNEAYLTEIRNQTKKLIHNTVANVLINLQENCG